MGQAGFTSNWGEFEWVEADTLLEPSGMAIDRNTGRVFVVDMQNWRVLSWPSQAALKDGQEADLVIGQPDFGEQDWDNPSVTANSLLYPAGIAVDHNGNLYVADTPNHRVLVYYAQLSNGMAASVVIGQPDFISVTQLLTPTASSLLYPRGLAVDSLGNLYVADTENNRVLEFDAPLTNNKAASRVLGQGGSFTTNGPNQGGLSANTLWTPYGVAVDAANNLYVADSNNNRVLEYDTPLTGDTTADRVWGQGGVFTTQIPNKNGVSANSLYFPTGVAVDAAGNLYVADTGNHRVLEYDAALTGDTTADRVFGQHGSFSANQSNNSGLTSDALSGPRGLAVDTAGNLYIADTENNRALVYLKPVPFKVYLPVVIKQG
jgi:sugar lactone lactonase YvrE